jgi:HlyD family secretion protein
LGHVRKLIMGVGVAALALSGLYYVTRPSGSEANAAAYRTVSVDRGPVVASVKATGALNPVSTVLVGSQLSGQIIEILVDYNAQVKSGQVVARLNADQTRSRRDAAQADLSQAKAELSVKRAQADRARATRLRANATVLDLEAQRERAVAQLADARRTLDRQRELFARGVGAKTAFDTARTQFDVQIAALNSADALIASARAEWVGLDADIALADAQVKAGEAAILQREAKLADIEIDLYRSDIRSPVDGVVVQRQVELGQTVAASLSTPTLFQIAQDLREIEIYANIDESDVGRLIEGQNVTFAVNAYPNRTFQGKIKMVRLGATTIQNVVTYTAVVTVANADMALLPGMTANIQIVTDNRPSVLRVTNAALRYRPVGAAPVGLAQARPLPDAGNDAQGGGGGQGAGGQALVALRERIVADIKPTPEQLKAIDAAIAEGREALRSSRAGLSPEERRGLGVSMRRELSAKIAQALDPERKAKYEQIVAENRSTRGQIGSPGRVYVTDEKGELRTVNLRTGVTDGTYTEVLSGDIAEGQSVVIGGGSKTEPAGSTGSPAPRGPRLF